MVATLRAAAPAVPVARDITTGPLAVVASTADVLAGMAGGEGWLSRAERERAAAFRHRDDRRDFVAAHFLVRRCAARLLGVAPQELLLTQSCDRCDRPHGKPTIAHHSELHVSLSHAAGVVAAAAGLDPVGIDVEALGRYRFAPGELDSVLSPREVEALQQVPDYQRALIRQWVRKEAFVKVGAATLDTLAGIDLPVLPIDDGPGSTRAWNWGGWSVLDWVDMRRRTIGTVVAARSPHLEILGG